MRTRTLRTWVQVGGLTIAGLGLTGCGLTQPQYISPPPPQARMQTPPTTGASLVNAKGTGSQCWNNACPPAPDAAMQGPAGAINAPTNLRGNPATFGGPQAGLPAERAHEREVQPVNAASGRGQTVLPADLKSTEGALPVEGRQTGGSSGGRGGELPSASGASSTSGASSGNRPGSNRPNEVLMPPPPPPIPMSAANGPSPLTMTQATPLPSSAASGMVPPPPPAPPAPPAPPSTLPGLAPPPAPPAPPAPSAAPLPLNP